jgi:hypothetical protein
MGGGAIERMHAGTHDLGEERDVTPLSPLHALGASLGVVSLRMVQVHRARAHMSNTRGLE